MWCLVMQQGNLTFEWTDENGNVLNHDPNAAVSLSQYTLGLQGGPITYQGAANRIMSGSGTRIVSVEQRLEAIEQRLAILNIDQDPTHQMLSTLYKKYKMVEALASKKDIK